MGSLTAVQFRNVSVSLDEKPIVSHLDFEVQAGETLVLLGRSGSGKTTTLKLVNRLIQPSLGEVLVEEKPTMDWDPIVLRRHIGYVIQETGLFPHFTIERNVAVVPTLLGWSKERIRSRTEELLLLVGLPPNEFLDRYPRELSGGQRQRIGVARALAADPPIVLMDEPFGALDPITRGELQVEFAELAKKLKKTILFVTHDLREAFFLASRIGLFQNGSLVELLSPSEFLRSNHPEARSFAQSLQKWPLGT